MTKRRTWLLALLLAACGDDSSKGKPDSDAEREDVHEFGSPADAEDGYTRYTSSVREVQPGETLMLVEWVAAPFDEDMDIMDVKGAQTLGGHHATLSGSREVEEVGTVRDYRNEDQLSSTFLGAVGEMSSGGNLPKNYGMRLRKGQGLYLQTHYVNLTDEPIEVRSYVDVKFEEPSDEHTILSSFSNLTLQNLAAPQQETTQVVECVTQEDLSLVMFTNHMHEWGKSTRTEALLPDGSTIVIKDDPVWNYEWATAANYGFAFDEPIELPKGTTLRTTCTWENTTDRMLTFPDEMCVFSSRFPGEYGVSCADGQWRKSTGEGETSSTPLTRVGEGACSGDADFSALPPVREQCMALPKSDIAGCGLPLLSGDAQCIVDCFEEGGISAACGSCYGDYMKCNAAQCASACSNGADTEECVGCQRNECCPSFETCSGVSC